MSLSSPLEREREMKRFLFYVTAHKICHSLPPSSHLFSFFPVLEAGSLAFYNFFFLELCPHSLPPSLLPFQWTSLKRKGKKRNGISFPPPKKMTIAKKECQEGEGGCSSMQVASRYMRIREPGSKSFPFKGEFSRRHHKSKEEYHTCSMI